MNGIQKWLQGQQRNPHPRNVRLHSLGEYMNQSYWLRIDERADDGPAEVTAQVDKKNRFQVETRGVKRLTIFLDDELVRL